MANDMRVVTFGEILLRLAPQGHKKILQDNLFEATFCGAEANVAVSLAQFGLAASFVSKIPNNAVGRSARSTLNYFGVDTSNVIFGGERMGLYYLEKGASQRPSKVIYDRANSAISKASPDEFDWETIFNNCDWFHFTGINPALGENMYIACINACKAAKAKNITISCDMNYRSKLWTEDEANLKMRELFKYVDVSIGNEEDADKIFGINAHNTDVERGSIDKKGYKEVARKICDQYGCKYAAITLRTSLSASVNRWAGVIYSNETDECHVSQEYTISIVDRVGSGDSFAAGIIYALLNEFGCKKSVEFAAAASCLKHTQEGDFNRSSVEDVFSLMYGDSSGRVRR